MKVQWKGVAWALLAMPLIAGMDETAWAQGRSDVVWQVGTMEVEADEPVAPAGIAFSARSGEFLVMGKRGGNLLRFSEARGPARKLALPAAIGNPINVAYDERHGRLLMLNPGNNRLIELRAGSDGVPRPNAVRQYTFSHRALRDPQGMTVDPRTGELYILDAAVPEIVRIRPDSAGGFDSPEVSSIDIRSHGLGAVELRGIAIDPGTGHLHVLSPADARLYEVKDTGVIEANRDVSDLGLREPAGMTFAPSRDQTDDPDIMNLFIADSASGLSEGDQQATGSIAELSLTMTPMNVRDSCPVPGTLVRVINAWQFVPPSPDTSGATYITPSGTLLLSDSEVNEMGDIFTGDNLFEITLEGTLLKSSTTIHFSDEPTGLAYNPWNGHLYVSDDTGSRGIYVWNPGPDGLFNTPDDILTYLDSRKYDPPSSDPEGVAFDSHRGVIYLADGVNREVYVISPGPSGVFNGVPPQGDDVVTHWDTFVFGVRDPEGITFDTDTGHLYVVGNPRTCLAHVTVDGTFIRGIDISAANPVKPAGLAYAPSSVDSRKNSVYITDRGIDNNDDPDENDGKVYEFSFPPLTGGNLPPTVDAGPDQVVIFPGVVNLNGVVSDDGLPGPLTTTWSVQSGPGTVTFGHASAAVTTASFSSLGTYVLRLTAFDGELTNADEMSVQVNPGGEPSVIEIRIAARSDDAEEDIHGVVDIKSSDLELIRDKTDQTVGMRFPGLDIPRGATITDAYIQFQVKSIYTTNTSLVIQGQAVDDASTFVTANHSISTRPRTSAAVPWQPTIWRTIGEAGPEQRTPNLKTVLQEIVDRPGWASGQAMAFIVTGQGRRTVWAYDGNSSGAPLLRVEFATSDGPPANTPPLAVDDLYATDQDTVLQVPAPGVLGNDSDADNDPLTAVLGTGPSNGMLQLNANGSFSYTPNAGFSGSDSFTYRASDGTAHSNVATVEILVYEVEGENTAPVAANDSYATDKDTLLQVPAPGVLGNDTDADNDPLTAVLATGPSNGTLQLNANGSFTYAPASGFSGSDSFKYRAHDGTTTSNLATVSITVNPAVPGNTPPTVAITAPANGASFPQGQSVSFTGTANDAEDGNLTSALSWTSSRDGVIGSGGAFSTSALSIGSHQITAAVTDSGGLNGQAAITVTVTDTSPNAFVTSPAGASGYSTWGGKNNNSHLRVVVTVTNASGAPVAGASVTARLLGPSSVTTTAVTNSLGQVEIKVTNALSGTYTTEVTAVSGPGIRWDNVTPQNSFLKP